MFELSPFFSKENFLFIRNLEGLKPKFGTHGELLIEIFKSAYHVYANDLENRLQSMNRKESFTQTAVTSFDTSGSLGNIIPACAIKSPLILKIPIN